jgi:hypothetical protein
LYICVYVEWYQQTKLLLKPWLIGRTTHEAKVFYFMELIRARFATDEETKSFYKFLNSKQNDKNDFTKKWLKTNGVKFIDLHQRFYDEFNQYNKDKAWEKHSLMWNKWNEDAKYFERRKREIGRCVRGRSEGLYQLGSKLMIGCTNFFEKGFEHTKIYEPINEPIYQDFDVELSTNYLNDLKTFYELPKELKQSILVDFLLINNIKLLANVEGKLSITTSVREKSSKREDLFKSFLEEKFIKLYHQKIIIAKFTDTTKTHFIPDFIGVTENSIYLIEQKKNAGLINQEQTQRYLLALGYIKKETKSDKVLKLLYLVEEGTNDLYNNILNFKNINDYEFN